MFCNVSEPFDLALIPPLRSATLDLNENDLEKIASLERWLGLLMVLSDCRQQGVLESVFTSQSSRIASWITRAAQV